MGDENVQLLGAKCQNGLFQVVRSDALMERFVVESTGERVCLWFSCVALVVCGCQCFVAECLSIKARCHVSLASRSAAEDQACSQNVCACRPRMNRTARTCQNKPPGLFVSAEATAETNESALVCLSRAEQSSSTSRFLRRS